MSANRARAIFIELVSEVAPEQWEGRLAELAGEDQEVRSKVAALLAAHRQEDSFLEGPAALVRATGTFDPAGDGSAVARSEGPGTAIGPYELLEEIGEGGMGAVWMAEQREPMQRKVALKIIKAGMDTRQVVARFEAERQALALMDHPNIAKVFDGGTTDTGRPYFVMELVKGVPITRYCDEHRLTPRERLELFLPVCQAIQHAHQKGIIHRDVKPANILVAPYDGRPVPKVIDFGVAKATGQRLTEHTLFTAIGAVVGTLEYMSPEQAELNNQDIDTRSDIYSLGVLLYELLTGTTPLGHERLKEVGFAETLRLIREEEPPRPSTRLNESKEALPAITAQRHMEPARLTKLVRGELDWIVMKALEKDRSRRYETANGLAMDVQHYLADEPVLACPPSAAYRLGKFARRNKARLAVAGLVLMGLVLAVVGLSVDDARVTWQKQQTEEALRNETAAKNGWKAALDRERQLSYLRRIALARHEIQDNDVDRANKILDECVPAAGQADPRHWEWHYLKRLCRGPLFTIRGNALYGHRVAFSPDGRRLAMGTSDAVFFLDAATGQLLRDYPPLRSAHPPHSEDWYDRSGFSGQVTLSPDGQCLAAAGLVANTATALIQVWHLGTRQEVAALRCRLPVLGVAFSPDSRFLAAAWGYQGIVTVWDAVTGREVRSLKGHSPQARSVAFSPDGKTLATAGGSGDMNPVPSEIELWDVATGKRITTLPGHAGGINSLAFSRDGLLASASGDRTVRLWNPSTGQQLALFPGHTSYVRSVAFSPDGKTLASGSSDTTVRVWALAPDAQSKVFRGHTSEVVSLAFSPDSQRLVSVDEQHTVKVWDTRTSPEMHTLRGTALAAAFSPDSRSLALANWWDLFVYDPTTARRQLLLRQPHNWPEETAVSLAFSPDGRRLALAGEWGVRSWDLAAGKEVAGVGLRDPADSLAFSLDGRRLARIQENDIKVYDAAAGREIVVLHGHTIPTFWASNITLGVSVSADGKKLASAADRDVTVWDLGSGQAIRTLRGPHVGHATPMEHMTRPGVALSPDGRLVAASRYDVKVWEVTTGRELHTLRGHTDLIHLLAFSPDGRRLASASMDGSVILWDMATGQEAFSFRAPLRRICCLAFSPDGRRIVFSASRSRPTDLAFVDMRDVHESEVTIWDADETRPEVEAAFQAGQKVDQHLREARFDLGGWLNAERSRGDQRRAAVARGRSHSGRGQWREAAAAYAEASRVGPSAVLAHHYEQAAALLLADDRDGYHRACAAALDRLPAMPDPWVAQWVARIGLLDPDPTLDRAKLVRLAEQAVVAHPRIGPWLQTLGAAHYRAGQLDRALARLQESESADWYGYPTVVNWLLLAQVHHRLGHAREARQWLDRAAARLDRATQTTPTEQAEFLKLDLPDLMACRLLRREAQFLITGHANDAPSAAGPKEAGAK